MEIFHRHMHFEVNLSVLLTSLILDQELSFCSCKIQLVPSRYDIYSAKGIRFTDVPMQIAGHTKQKKNEYCPIFLTE